MKCDESLVFIVAEVVSNQFKSIKAMKKIFLRYGGHYKKLQD